MTVRELIQKLLLETNLDDEIFVATEDSDGKEIIFIDNEWKGRTFIIYEED